MNANVATLINLIGFVTGAALYLMLLVMVVRASQVAYVSAHLSDSSTIKSPSKASINLLLLITAILGMLWNFGGFALYGLKDLGFATHPIAISAAFTMLGFLPAVVVHAVLREGKNFIEQKGSLFIIFCAYLLSGIAGGVHFLYYWLYKIAPSHIGLHILTIGFGLLTVALLFLTRKQAKWRRAMWVVALAVFAVSALHLSHHEEGYYPWWIELTGHHASLPLVLAILYQDYRFALMDSFLKRALVLVLLVAIAFTLYIGIAAPLLAKRDLSGESDPRAIGLLLALWVMTALLYPSLRRLVDWFVDKIVLRRANYDILRTEMARDMALCETPDAILDRVCDRLTPALTAHKVCWITVDQYEAIYSNLGYSHPGHLLLPLEVGESSFQELLEILYAEQKWPPAEHITAAIAIPTTEPPHLLLVIGELAGGRRLLSDDIAILETIALLAARRIDALHVNHARCEMNLREQEISKLATEAELRALRAQINPHFLFNALTTIGYLIQTTPEKALETLMRLTGLLRGILRRSEGEFSTLAEEVELIRSYLDIEHARFEERLRVSIDIPPALNRLKIPALLIQPLVENAIKHGISPCKAGGEVKLTAELINSDKDQQILKLQVCDTGAGVSDIELAKNRKRGVGLINVERRLKCHYGDVAILSINSTLGKGTTVNISLPLNNIPHNRNYLFTASAR